MKSTVLNAFSPTISRVPLMYALPTFNNIHNYYFALRISHKKGWKEGQKFYKKKVM